MTRHPIDATALIFGALFALAGLAIISEQAWPDVNTTAVVGATVGVLGLVFVVTLVMRQLSKGSQPPPLSEPATAVDESEAVPVID